ncbi:hypothetical protein KGM_212778 [Danaus plexippus plexippus]|uniref:Uncharacterized protein n=1 Tax=Danaus plexippus plexippus TaxID=278856 RepID=A0A212F296_DANPL|nr:uncharacterized protein LOC116777625 [Danaus plexippus plexippus]OWR47860.1 hypothetical protein KGM_212778 [Danaus plexippus plexippus]
MSVLRKRDVRSRSRLWRADDCTAILGASQYAHLRLVPWRGSAQWDATPQEPSHRPFPTSTPSADSLAEPATVGRANGIRSDTLHKIHRDLHLGSGGQLSGRADLAISATVGVVQHAELPPWHHQPQRTTSDHNEPLFGRGKFDTSIRRILNMIFG